MDGITAGIERQDAICLALITCIAIAETVTLPLTLVPSCAWSGVTASISTGIPWHLTIAMTWHWLSSVWGWLGVPTAAAAWSRTYNYLESIILALTT